LTLSNNPLGVGAGVVFGAWPIEQLFLSRTELGDDGACALFDYGIQPTELHLVDCGLGDRALEHLAKPPALHKLHSLWIAENAITDRGIRALVAAAPAKLRQIRIPKNRIGDDGVVALATWPQLLHVDVDGNPFGDAGKTAMKARPTRCCP